MKTIFHIGQHKTATTSIQRYLAHHRVSMKTKGIYFPLPFNSGRNSNHFQLNLYALNDSRFSPKKELLLQKDSSAVTKIRSELPEKIERVYEDAEKHGCETVLWSNEGLYLLNSEEEYERLLRLVRQYSKQVTAACCFRNPEEFLASYTKELLKNKLQAEPTELDSYRYVEPDSWLVDYARKKVLLEQVFDSCIFWEYDPKDNVRSFLHNLNLPVVDSTDIRVNTSQNDTRSTNQFGRFRRLSAFVKPFRLFWEKYRRPHEY